MLGHRNMLCGMHVHVAVPDPTRRVDLMTRMLPYVPLLVALSTSSPFWQGRRTGLMGYRLAAYDELPRTGLPELFASTAEYDAYVSALVRSGAIEDATHVWWAIRPSPKYPTLELRAPDCCTRVEDSIAVAALFRALVVHLYDHPSHNKGLTPVGRSVALENKWRAQRYGVRGTFATERGSVSVADMLEWVLELVGPEAEALGCLADVEHCRTILLNGTSADAQIRIYAEREPIAGPEAALKEVARWIAQTTMSAPTGREPRDQELALAPLQDRLDA
jgi:carboxylate-amine ligase